jgi:hypothetical protein
MDRGSTGSESTSATRRQSASSSKGSFYCFPRSTGSTSEQPTSSSPPFAALRIRTDTAKRFKKVDNATAGVWKMPLVAERKFRRLNAPKLVKEVYLGVRFVNGERREAETRRPSPDSITHLLTGPRALLDPCPLMPRPKGFSNRNLREPLARLLGQSPAQPGRMSYDLWRLRLHASSKASRGPTDTSSPCLLEDRPLLLTPLCPAPAPRTRLAGQPPRRPKTPLFAEPSTNWKTKFILWCQRERLAA